MSDTPTREAVHTQTVDGFGTVRVLRLDPHADAATVHAWVREERAAFWGMNGLTKEQVAGIYAHLDTLDTHHAYLLERDGEPAGLLQTYEPEADRVSECYPVEPGDIGIHLLVPPPARTARTPAGRRRCCPPWPRTCCWSWTDDGSWSTRTCATRRPSPVS